MHCSTISVDTIREVLAAVAEVFCQSPAVPLDVSASEASARQASAGDDLHGERSAVGRYGG